MEFIIISGLSGAGKSSAAAFLEDLGFYCVDNMPVALISNFAGLCMAGAGTGKYSRVALVTDIRGGSTSSSSSRPPTRTSSGGIRRPGTPTPSPGRATPCPRR